jgi:hypothetical protein
LGLLASAAVQINSPINGATVAAPVQVNASGSYSSAMLLYVDNIFVLERRDTSSISTALNVAPGSHLIKVLAEGADGVAVAMSRVTVSSSSTGASSSPSVAAQIAGDMQGRNEAYPHGVPLSYDWANGPVMIMGNNANGWGAITSWGAVYEAVDGNPATNTRVNIRDMQTYFLQKSSGKWLLLQNTSTPTGAAYLEDFSGDVNKPGDIRREPDGTISVTAGGGYNLHFYPENRAAINPSDIGGIVVVLQARLIVGNSSKPDDRGSARYLCGSGADYYPDLTGGWPGSASFNPGIAVGKMKFVKSAWRSFAMTTLTESRLQGNPPPVNLTGILP